MIRRLLTFGYVLSLLLCLATVVLWAIQPNPMVVAMGNHYTTAELRAEDGVYLSLWKYAFDVKAATTLNRPFIRMASDGWLVADVKTDGYEARQFSAARTRFFDGPQRQFPIIRQYFLKLPFWFVASAFLVPPAYGIFFRGHRKPPPGCCSECGYDLCASKDRCPECGTPIRLNGRVPA